MQVAYENMRTIPKFLNMLLLRKEQIFSAVNNTAESVLNSYLLSTTVRREDGLQ
jgi:hypothetical protein